MMLLLAMKAYGGETNMVMFSPVLGAALQYDAAMLKPDGSGAFNLGLFQRRKVGEFFSGYMDPSFGPVAPVIGSQFATLADLQAAIASGAEPALKYQMIKTTGKGGGVDAMDRWVTIKGNANLTKTYPDNPALGIFNPGWDSEGNTGLGRGALVWAGERTSSNPSSPVSQLPSVWSAGLNLDLDIMPASTHAEYYDEGIYERNVKFNCDNGCVQEKLHNSLPTRLFQLDTESLGALTKAGVADPTCALTCERSEIRPPSLRSAFTPGYAVHRSPHIRSTSRSRARALAAAPSLPLPIWCYRRLTSRSNPCCDRQLRLCYAPR